MHNKYDLKKCAHTKFAAFFLKSSISSFSSNEKQSVVVEKDEKNAHTSHINYEWFLYESKCNGFGFIFHFIWCSSPKSGHVSYCT